MSDFSSKCREYLTDTGETVYQLASSTAPPCSVCLQANVCPALTLSTSSATPSGLIHLSAWN